MMTYYPVVFAQFANEIRSQFGRKQFSPDNHNSNEKRKRGRKMKHLLLMSQALGSDCNELRVFGEYSGRLDAEEVEKLPGYELFINFCTCKTLVEGLFHNSYNSPDDSGPDWSIDQDEVDDICYELEFLINTICKKVGIAVSEPKSDEHLKFDQDILARWYHFYEYHFNHILTQTEWYAFKWRRRNGGDVSEFLPKGNWRNHIC